MQQRRSQAMEQTRAWRGLRIWFPLKLYGIDPFRRNLEEKLALAAYAAQELRSIPGIELVAEPVLSVLAFRLVRPGLFEEEIERLNHDLLDLINEKKTIFLMGIIVNGTYALRMCILSFRTHSDRIQSGIEDIRQAVLELCGEARTHGRSKRRT